MKTYDNISLVKKTEELEHEILEIEKRKDKYKIYNNSIYFTMPLTLTMSFFKMIPKRIEKPFYFVASLYTLSAFYIDPHRKISHLQQYSDSVYKALYGYCDAIDCINIEEKKITASKAHKLEKDAISIASFYKL